MAKFSIRSRITSIKYAFEGIASMIKYEHNSRIHLIAAVLVILLGLIVHLSLIEWVAITITIGLVFVTELINSALELLADLIDPEANPKIKRIKDYAAASVLVSAIIAVIAGVLIFVPKIIEIIK
jgi:undecaprenol kinase/diacylglycerol kinase (ATP)